MNDINLYKVYKTISSMLQKRGLCKIDIPDYETFKNIPKNKLHINIPNKILVYFPDEEKIGVKTIRICLNEMVENNIKRSIIIVKDNITPFAKYEIDSLVDYHIEIFKESELINDITEHELVPKHEKISEEEKNMIFKKYNITEKQLPYILHSDVICKFYGFEKSNIIKITRPSETSGIYEYYRLVV